MYITLIKKYKYIISAILLNILLVYLIVFYAPYGASNYLKIKNELNKISSEVEVLKKQNVTLKNEITKLKNDKEYIEEVARKQFGLLKNNEMIFQFPSNQKARKND